MKPVSGFRLMVLKYLKAQGREVPRAELIAHLWGSNPPKGADRRIAALMVNIRKAGYLPVTSTSYRFDGEILARRKGEVVRRKRTARRCSPVRYVALSPARPRRTHLKSILNCLLINQGRIVSSDELAQYLWGDDPDGGPLGAAAVVNQYIMRLRRKGWEIDNVHGRGFAIWWRGQTPIKPVIVPNGNRNGRLYTNINRMAA
jgi:hypothetical protein